MKKIIALALSVMLVMSLSVTAFAAEVNQDSNPKTSNTTITTSIAPTYTVTIPADTNIVFNATSTDFGKVELTTAQLDPNYVVKVSAEAGELKNKADETKTIPYTLNVKDGAVFTSAEYDDDGESTALTLDITQDNWNKAYAGQYEGVITFTVEYKAAN